MLNPQAQYMARLNLPVLQLVAEIMSMKKCVGWKPTQEEPALSLQIVVVEKQMKMDYATQHVKLAILAKVQYVGKIAHLDLETMVHFVANLQLMDVEQDILGNLVMDLMTMACTKDVMQHMVQAIARKMVQLYIQNANQDITM
jgi:hypothetical protein